jgi:hypothetical protein
MAKTPIFRQRTGAQHAQLPPRTGNHYSPPSNTIQLCSLALNTAPQPPPSLRPRSPPHLPSLALPGPPHLPTTSRAQLTIGSPRRRCLSPHNNLFFPLASVPRALLPLLTTTGPDRPICRGLDRWIATQIPPTSPEALGELMTTFWESARPPYHGGR